VSLKVAERGKGAEGQRGKRGKGKKGKGEKGERKGEKRKRRKRWKCGNAEKAMMKMPRKMPTNAFSDSSSWQKASFDNLNFNKFFTLNLVSGSRARDTEH
jgi:hypothetical protein